jgi:tetratricopeptide (TPR) repeat protein
MTDDDAPSQDSEEPERRLSPEELEAGLKTLLADCERDRADLLRRLVAFYLHTGRPQAAVPYVERLLASSEEPADQAGFLLALGQLMEQVQDLEAAAGFYRRGLALEAGGPEVRYLLHNNLGFCLNRFGRHAEAEPLCLAAIAIAPDRYNAHKNLGVAWEGQGWYGEAARSYVRAVQRNPQDPRALHHLEGMLARHPEVAAELPELLEALEECRTLAGAGRWVQ